MRTSLFALLPLLACGKGAHPSSGGDGAPSGEIGCTQGGFMEPNYVPEDKLGLRYGAGATYFSELNTTQDRAVEVCGAREQVAALMRYKCADGSNPYPDFATAHSSRAGNTGPGGRCGMIIDLYQVPCPEGTYQVHMDLYSCPPGRSAY